MKTLLIDNYDSYTYNLYQLIAEINEETPIVVYNNQYSWSELRTWNIDNIVISPGPGNPANEKDFGVNKDIILNASFPVLGVCLGHQGLGYVFGGIVTHAPEVMHGRASHIYHNNSSLFSNIPQGFSAIRYHSLIVENALPYCLEKTAWTQDGLVMGLRHKERPLWGVQFHPEAICTEYGKQIIENFRDLTNKARSRS